MGTYYKVAPRGRLIESCEHAVKFPDDRIGMLRIELRKLSFAGRPWIVVGYRDIGGVWWPYTDIKFDFYDKNHAYHAYSTWKLRSDQYQKEKAERVQAQAPSHEPETIPVLVGVHQGNS